MRALEHPECLTTDDIAAIMADENLCDLYDTAALIKGAASAPAKYDLDAEWEAMLHRLPRRRSAMMRRWAASITLAAVIGAGATALVISSRERPSDAVTAELPAEQTAPDEGTSALSPSASTAEEAERIEFDNVSLAQIARSLEQQRGWRIMILSPDKEAIRLHIAVEADDTADDFAAMLAVFDSLDVSHEPDGTIIIK